MKRSAERGSQNVETSIDGNEKDCFTVMATIAAAQTKLPLLMIASGEMDLCELAQFGEDTADHRDGSPISDRTKV
jgi:hypothetical protein